MATLLSLVNNVLPEIGLPTLTSIVGSTNQTARLALALANRTGRSLAKHDWRILIKRNVLTTASSAESYALPSDFDHFIHQTEWNETTARRLFGPDSDDAWQAVESGAVTTTVDDRFQVRADGNSNRIFISPLPTSSENLTFFYAANTWCRAAGGARQSSFAADNDVLLLDEFVFELGLKWRLLRAHQREYQIDLAEFLRELQKRKALDGGLKTLRILGPVEEWTPAANVGETNFGA
jgi:hypothetical protein